MCWENALPGNLGRGSSRNHSVLHGEQQWAVKQNTRQAWCWPCLQDSPGSESGQDPTEFRSTHPKGVNSPENTNASHSQSVGPWGHCSPQFPLQIKQNSVLPSQGHLCPLQFCSQLPAQGTAAPALALTLLTCRATAKDIRNDKEMLWDQVLKPLKCFPQNFPRIVG